MHTFLPIFVQIHDRKKSSYEVNCKSAIYKSSLRTNLETFNPKIYNPYSFSTLSTSFVGAQILGQYTVCPSKIDTMPRNMLIIKNPQFLPNFYGTLSK